MSYFDSARSETENQRLDKSALASSQVMRYPERVKKKRAQKKKSVKIYFSKPENNEKTVVEAEGVEKPVPTAELLNEKPLGSLQTQHFEDVVCQLAQLCLVHVNEKHSERHLVFLSLLLQSFHTPRVFSVSPDYTYGQIPVLF